MTDPIQPAPETDAPLTAARVDFPCANCGADMTWDPDEDALHCEYCQRTVTVPGDEGVIVERALEDVGEAARGLGLDVRVAKCSVCAARVTFNDRSTSELCVYCGAPSVLAQEANRNAIRPESLVPLDVGRSQVEGNFRKWLKGLWFRPNDLKRTKKFEAVGIYVPFWTFDCQVHSDWSADAGHYYYVTRTVMRTVNGRRRPTTVRVRKVRWVPAWGDRDDHYDDTLINASKGLPPELVSKLGGFVTQGLVPYKPHYLAGWCAEEYQVDLESGWDQARDGVVETQRQRCAGDVPGDTQRNLRVRNTIRDVRWKHILLPIWSLQYRYGGKPYTVLIHGQTGRVAGKAPLSWIKIALFVLVLIGVGGTVAIVAGING